ncbi:MULTISPECIES: hypothetical protein [Asaia]|uniref:hypothetical protein n=1 Tax=Asaia TaxID=91914 RepID=UPI00126861D9|nr:MULTISPECIES: hypothetical protein [Asaia]
MAKSPSLPKEKNQPKTVSIPAENLEILQEALGVNIGGDKEILLARVVASSSRSVSPYTSAEMLRSYVEQGMPEVKDRALAAIDEERAWRRARDEQEQNHQHALDLDERAQQRRSQRNSFNIAVLGMGASLVAGYFNTPLGICITVACASIGGPPVATILARLMATKNNIEK